MYTKGTSPSLPALDNESCYRLVSAIIYSAFEDASITDKDIEDSPNEKIKLNKIKHRTSAINFFKSNLFKNYCDLINLNPEYVHRLLKTELKRRSKNNGRNLI